MSIEITVLGSDQAWPSPGRACSGYLLRTEESTVLMDCGTGVLERLRAVIAPEELTAIVISHLHLDHWADLIPLRYYLMYEAKPAALPRLYMPPGTIDTVQRAMDLLVGEREFLTCAFEPAEYDPAGRLEIGDIRCRFDRTRHPIETFAVRIDAGEGTLVFSADTGWDESVATFATGASTFLCDANWGAGESVADMHLTGAEAGRLASLARVGRLVLTHLPEREAAGAQEAALREYAGPVEYAREGQTFTV